MRDKVYILIFKHGVSLYERKIIKVTLFSDLSGVVCNTLIGPISFS